jgi:hypothetical protein
MPRLLMLSRELLYFKYLGFEIQLKPEQRKSIINLLRGEDAGYRDSSYGIRKSLIFSSIIHFKYIGKSNLARAGIEYSL